RADRACAEEQATAQLLLVEVRLRGRSEVFSQQVVICLDGITEHGESSGSAVYGLASSLRTVYSTASPPSAAGSLSPAGWPCPPCASPPSRSSAASAN